MDVVSVSDGPVSAADGATLNGFVADVEYKLLIALLTLLPTVKICQRQTVYKLLITLRIALILAKQALLKILVTLKQPWILDTRYYQNLINIQKL